MGKAGPVSRLSLAAAVYTLPGKGASISRSPCRGAGRMTIFTSTRKTGGTGMNSFKDREKGFENKFAHDQEMQFKAMSRANKLVGLWAAGLLGKQGDEASAYAIEVVKADFEEAGHEDVYRKLAKDLGDKADETTIRSMMAESLRQAKEQLMTEVPSS
jgi:hypothetical protein